MLILDTNVLLRISAGWKDQKISYQSERFVADAQIRGEAAISAATVWEIGEQAEKGHIQTDLDLVKAQLVEDRIMVISIDFNIAARAAQLHREWPGKDPADRFIMATALLTSSPLVTIDTEMIAWDGPVQVVDARR